MIQFRNVVCLKQTHNFIQRKQLIAHLVVHGPAHIFKITVVKKSIAVHFHPHADLLDADCSDLCYRITKGRKKIN